MPGGWTRRTLQHLAARHESLNTLLLKYLHVVLVQTARSVACCRFHSLEQRLARWLLTHSDRNWSRICRSRTTSWP